MSMCTASCKQNNYRSAFTRTCSGRPETHGRSLLRREAAVLMRNVVFIPVNTASFGQRFHQSKHIRRVHSSCFTLLCKRSRGGARPEWKSSSPAGFSLCVYVVRAVQGGTIFGYRDNSAGLNGFCHRCVKIPCCHRFFVSIHYHSLEYC